jgi:hypothetical protein
MCSHLFAPIRLRHCLLHLPVNHWACFLQWPRGLLLHGPPGTGKVLSLQFRVLTLYFPSSKKSSITIHKSPWSAWIFFLGVEFDVYLTCQYWNMEDLNSMVIVIFGRQA